MYADAFSHLIPPVQYINIRLLFNRDDDPDSVVDVDVSFDDDVVEYKIHVIGLLPIVNDNNNNDNELDTKELLIGYKFY